MGRVRALTRLCVLYAGLYLTTEEKHHKNLGQSSLEVPLGHDSVCQHGHLCG